MVFSSLQFLFLFLPVFLMCYCILPDRWRNLWILLGSIGFYVYGALDTPFAIALLLLSIVVNYGLGRLIGISQKHKKLFLVLGLIYDFLVLFVYKYLDFILKNINALIDFVWPETDFSLPLAGLVLPIGISFYTFQIVSYLVDVYRGEVQPERSLIKVGAYLTMFPQLIAGPIVTYSSVQSQLDRRRISLSRINDGLCDFTIGLGLKVLLANQIGKLWSEIGALGYESISTPLAWMGAIAYSMQLYFDFYGYSRMAIGLGKMMGFSLPVNFEHPYIAGSFTDFWRRWHITLSSWFRDYLYIPLGGNREGKKKMYRNLLIVWALTGIWHGADWNFLLWGLLTFLLISAEKLGFGKFLSSHKVFSHCYMLLMIPITWVIFALTDFQQLGIYFTRLFPFFGTGNHVYAGDWLRFGKLYFVSLSAGLLFCTELPAKLYQKLRGSILSTVVLLVIFWASVYCLYIGLDDPFLYFRF